MTTNQTFYKPSSVLCPFQLQEKPVKWKKNIRQIYHITVKITSHTVWFFLAHSQRWRDFFSLYVPLRTDGNYDDIMNRELSRPSSELFTSDRYKYNKKTPEQRQNALRFTSNFLLFKSRHCRHIDACICCCELVCFCELWHLQFLLLTSHQLLN